VRVAVLVPNELSRNPQTPDSIKCFHPNCFVEYRLRAKEQYAAIEDPSSVKGWASLSDEEMIQTQRLLTVSKSSKLSVFVNVNDNLCMYICGQLARDPELPRMKKVMR
jgi:hypothetical protein